MDVDKLQEYIKLAKEAVKKEEEPFKSEGFKIILNKLLESSGDKKNQSDIMIAERSNISTSSTVEDGKRMLAEKCMITIDQLNDIISIKNDGTMEFFARMDGSDAKKHIIVTLCLLTVNQFVLGKEWLESTKIAECLRTVGVKDLANLSGTLKRYPLLIRAKGSRFGRKYRLTSNEGRAKAFDILRKLANNEKISI